MNDTKVTTLEEDTPVAAAAPVTEKATKEKATKAATSKSTAAAKEAGLNGDRKVILIHQGEGTAGREDVVVGVNGVMFNIKRGKPVDVPVEVVHVLENAVTTVYENGEAIDTPRFAFSVLGQ